MAIFVPSILVDNLEEYEQRASELLKIPELERIQVDFSDGIFTPRRTVQPSELDLLNPEYIWESHLMVADPQQYFFDCKLAGFNTIIFHFEACQDKNKISDYAQELKGYKITPGLAFQSDTDLVKVLADFPELAQLFEQITLLTVEPGYSGGEMDLRTPERVQFLKNKLKNVKIEVDGGVKIANAKSLAQAGADLLIINSALYKIDPEAESSEIISNLVKNFEKLQAEVNSSAFG